MELLKIQNPWWQGEGLKFDPVLLQYARNKIKSRPTVLDQIDFKRPGLYFLTGPRGVGKTTSLKLIVKKLIEEEKIKPSQIFYYSCHNLDSAEQLNEMIKLFLNQVNKKQRAFILIDEVAMIKNWQTGFNHLQKAGKLKNALIIFSSSTLEKIADGQMKLIIMNSLDFREFISLINPTFYEKIKINNYASWGEKIGYYLDIYFLTGGFMPAINDYQKNGAIRQTVYSNFLYWLSASIANIGRDIALTRQIMEKIIFSLGQPVGYKTLAQKTKAKTHLTAAEYLDFLEKMFVIKTVYQADEGRPTSRKAKKVYFQDQFIFWLFYSNIHGSLNYWQLAREHLHDPAVFSRLVENIILSHLIKDEKNKITYWRDNIKKREINFLVKTGKEITPILIRYDKAITEADLKIFKQAGFKKGIIISKDELASWAEIKIIPLAYFLMFYNKLA